MKLIFFYNFIIGLLLLNQINGFNRVLFKKAFLFESQGFSSGSHDSSNFYFFTDTCNKMNYVYSDYYKFDSILNLSSVYYDSVYGGYKAKFTKVPHIVSETVDIIIDSVSNSLLIKTEKVGGGSNDREEVYYLSKNENRINKKNEYNSKTQYLGDTIIKISNYSFNCMILINHIEVNKIGVIDFIGEFGYYYLERTYVDKSNLLIIGKEILNFKDAEYKNIIPSNSYINKLKEVRDMDYSKLGNVQNVACD